tara:strand:- start:273 stop:794 length:522 start_codon:yes stop_codon:yes gene_type:complete
MSQDFAKRHSKTDQSGRPLSKFGLFITGFISGVSVSFIVYLWQTVPDDIEAQNILKPDKTAKVEEMQWDFYEIFPKSEVPIIKEYEGGEQVKVEDSFAYILQTGSFKMANDANEMRAELLLMGLNASIRKVEVEGETWHRVIVGPLGTDLALNRAQDKLAQAQIESLPLRVNR